MKKRTDFVTNSSSSCFVCEICGKEKSGWDLSLCEADMYECENGHVFCTEHALEVSNEELIAFIIKNEYNKECYNYGESYTEDDLTHMEIDELIGIASEDGSLGVPECICPICNFLEYSKKDMRKYLEKEYEVDPDEVFSVIKEKNKRRKKLYDSEYIDFVCKQKGLMAADIVDRWKNGFKDYHEFKEYINKQ